MALVKCPECGAKVSTTAAACPSCGAPAVLLNTGNGNTCTPTTIQQTSKKLKAHLVISRMLLIIGAAWTLIAWGSSQPSMSQNLSITMLAIGAIWYPMTKLRIWWNHR